MMSEVLIIQHQAGEGPGTMEEGIGLAYDWFLKNAPEAKG